MKTKTQGSKKAHYPITLKALIVGGLILLLLIPGLMIENLISERKSRREATIEKINDKWSNAQTICGPVLSLPFQIIKNDQQGNVTRHTHKVNFTPEDLQIETTLVPEEKYYGIFKTIVYKSTSTLTGYFSLSPEKLPLNVKWKDASIYTGISDLRGVTKADIYVNNKLLTTEIENGKGILPFRELLGKAELSQDHFEKIPFRIELDLNGSGSIHYIPIGRNSQVDIKSSWNSPGFTGKFSPTHDITDSGFHATWKVLHFNRNIPDTWHDNELQYFEDSTFGVNLVNTVDHYQQNMRSAKYAVMFIALTFMVFFFVEVLTGKQIHPIQYLLVGAALILFYCLLLSFSEHFNFSLSYLIASGGIITLITLYTWSILKSKQLSLFLMSGLIVLYGFLYVILQLEDVALLIGSVGLFIILALVMYFSRKIDWYKNDGEKPVVESVEYREEKEENIQENQPPAINWDRPEENESEDYRNMNED